MVVKSKIGRRRYIIFKIESGSVLNKTELIQTLNRIVGKLNAKNKSSQTRMNQTEVKNAKSFFFINQPWVLFLRNNYGLIRCHHLDIGKTIELLQGLKYVGSDKQEVNIITLGITGTIRSARKKYLDKLFLYPLNSIYSK